MILKDRLSIEIENVLKQYKDKVSTVKGKEKKICNAFIESLNSIDIDDEETKYVLKKYL